MKMIALLLSVVASVVILTGCASQAAPTQPAPAAHHDYKGER